MAELTDRLSRILVVMDGHAEIRLRTIGDVEAYLNPSNGAVLGGIALALKKARTTQDKAKVLKAFVKWVQMTGLLLGTEPAMPLGRP
ncbi:hypothetical protein [Flaviflagellibacter deserti]|jgi:hypothetical protein|uniref:Uncharacterized protein n=1 Tax=Flaviflagellibacter deserti TaxID=2267266 RepID=A0ABV9Z2E3_9HYPH